MLNLERPFNVGDIITIDGEVEAQVQDISWRTTRAIDGLGKLHCIPNSKATETNLIRVTGGIGETYQMGDNVYVPTVSSPDVVLAALQRALDRVSTLDRGKEPPRAEMREMVLSNGRPFNQYRVTYTTREYGLRWTSKNELWVAIARELEAAGIEFVANLGGTDTKDQNAPRFQGTAPMPAE